MPYSFLLILLSLNMHVISIVQKCERLMRRYFCVTLVAVCFVSCQGGMEVPQAILSQIDSLEIVNASQARQLQDFSDFMSIVSNGLDSIAAQEKLLTGTDKGIEGHNMTKEELRANLDAFAALLERQRNRITQLEDSLQVRGESFGNLRNIITYLNLQLDEKNQTIASLQASLNSKNANIQQLNKQVKTLTASNEKLTEEVAKQGEVLVKQSDVINECYVKIGTKKELQQAGVLTGGFLSKKKLDVGNFQNAVFTKVDIRNFNELDISSKKIQILTSMPSSSYAITNNGNNTKLTITNPTLFWSVSNYLVIQIK